MKKVDGLLYTGIVNFNSSVDFSTEAVVEVVPLDITYKMDVPPYSILCIAKDLGWKPIDVSKWVVPYKDAKEFNEFVGNYVNHENCPFNIDFKASFKEVTTPIGDSGQTILDDYEKTIEDWLKMASSYTLDTSTESDFDNYVQTVASVDHKLEKFEEADMSSLVMVNEIFKQLHPTIRIPKMDTSIVTRQFMGFEDHVNFIFNDLAPVIDWHMKKYTNTNAFVFPLDTGHVVCTSSAPMWDGKKWKFDDTATLLFKYGIGSCGNFIKSRGNVINYIAYKMEQIELTLNFDL
jgi:hypothetical protein